MPLDSSYNHTIYFTSASAQRSYFQGLTKYTFTRQTYTRLNQGIIKLEMNAENLYDCNYLMFQNSAFGNRWFYAFINSVEYSNNATSIIRFVLDPMQTWFFDYSLGMNFVEREHSATDNIGDNIVDEGLATGPYFYSDGYQVTELLGLSIVVAATFDENYEDSAGGLYGGLYTALNYHTFPMTQQGAQEAIDFINGAGTKIDGIVSVFACPTNLITKSASAPSWDINIPKQADNIEGYHPKNNKLFTYPYNMLYIYNNNGDAKEYRYEYFTGDECQFDLLGTMSTNPAAMLVPKQYRGAGTVYDEKMIIEGWPQLPYVTDTFKMWCTQTGVNIKYDIADLGLQNMNTAVQSLSSAGSAAVSGGKSALAEGASVGGLSSISGGLAILSNTLNKVLGIMQSGEQHYRMPDQSHGTFGPTVLAANNALNFFIYNKHISEAYARSIDDYFTMFGYATKRLKVPNRSSRPHWNYVKTVGCVLTGSLPEDDANAICHIYDNGITFWKNGNEVGNYNLDNSP